jgi:hypothetical protein
VHAFTVGFGLGFFVALQLGPLSLYLIRSTLRNGWEVGLAIPLESRSSTWRTRRSALPARRRCSRSGRST